MCKLSSQMSLASTEDHHSQRDPERANVLQLRGSELYGWPGLPEVEGLGSGEGSHLEELSKEFFFFFST